MQSHKNFSPSLLLPSLKVDQYARQWLEEDCPSFDAAAVAAGSDQQTATLYAKSPLVVAGTSFFGAVFKHLGCTVTWQSHDGDDIPFASAKHKVALATVKGPAHALLRGERPSLNALAECCAIATTSRQTITTVQKVGWKGIVAGTRKTAPGLRLLQKFGMIVGGMDAHRYDLSSMVMIKDNHIQASGGIWAAVTATRRLSGFSLKIEVEAQDKSQALEACEANADIVMLDNFDVNELENVAKIIKSRWPNVLVETSGGINPDNIQSYCVPSVDIISFSINRYTKAVDLSLKLD